MTDQGGTVLRTTIGSRQHSLQHRRVLTALALLLTFTAPSGCGDSATSQAAEQGGITDQNRKASQAQPADKSLSVSPEQQQEDWSTYMWPSVGYVCVFDLGMGEGSDPQGSFTVTGDFRQRVVGIGSKSGGTAYRVDAVSTTTTDVKDPDPANDWVDEVDRSVDHLTYVANADGTLSIPFEGMSGMREFRPRTEGAILVANPADAADGPAKSDLAVTIGSPEGLPNAFGETLDGSGRRACGIGRRKRRAQGEQPAVASGRSAGCRACRLPCRWLLGQEPRTRRRCAV